MSTTEQKINDLIKQGQTFDQIVETKLSTPAYIKRCFTKFNNEQKPQPELNDLIEPVQKKADPLDSQMDNLIQRDPTPENPLAAAFKLIMENPQSFLLAFNSITQPQAKQIIVNKCHRHPQQDVKLGENCPKCITLCQQEQQRIINENTVLPCPTCKDQTKQTRGGYIKVLPKQGHYSCGYCKISYNIAGEKTPWGDKDQKFFDQASKMGAY